MNKNGKLVSKKKCITAALQNHLEEYNSSRWSLNLLFQKK
jgi:hypothetical protein